MGDYRRVRNEIGEFNEEMLSRPEVVAVSKIDVTGVEARCREAVQELGPDAQAVCYVSAVAQQGLDGLLDEVAKTLASALASQVGADGSTTGKALPVLKPRQLGEPEIVRKEGDRYEVTLRAATRVAAMIDGGDWNARAQLYDLLRRKGVIARLEKAGIRPGEAFRVGKVEWEWE